MSRHCCKKETPYRPMPYGLGMGMGMGYGSGNCCCNFPTLIILILIVLQFSKKRRGFGHDDCDRECDGGFGGQIGNGVLFIIALFFLSCCNPCRTSY